MNETVVVIGLGGMGSAAAYHLASRGATVVGLERFHPAHDRGSSHGGSRIIRQAYFEDPAYVPLLLRAYELWDALGADTGREVHRITGGLYAGPETSVTVDGSLRAAREYDLRHDVLGADEIPRRFPGFAPASDQIGVYEHLAGFARPEETVRAHLELAERAGADLRFGIEVLDWADTGDSVRVTTDQGVVHADRLVVCPGAWAPELLADLKTGIRIERQVMYWFDLAPTAPRMDDSPIYIHETDVGEQIYGFPAIDGPDGGVKTAFFRKGVDCSPDTIDRVVHGDEAQAMLDRVRRLIPGVGSSDDAASAMLHAATCMYSTTPDHDFVIARHPRHERVAVACGFSGHGFKFVPVVGEILADLVLEGTTRHPIGIFDPRRPALAAQTAGMGT
ncbi:N-methyl-L-tryptophan oxidase [Williamsia deligens]|uniref:N-methyl-L-tryptophan oxidase n=1 Tax=Williamsia deligens TaxID=321325 RepID=A0ABW3GCI3_9NOCA|nr:N-methyl-L-tryptophan oxidase [Williamsia deligens]MCP2195472.1 sarcosine oxidase [Williamsia deligens]